jgi:hypothetical protein
MYFDAGRTERNPLLNAHAWLDAAGVAVIGYPIEGRFAEVAYFI